jgi:hypothetical protein
MTWQTEVSRPVEGMVMRFGSTGRNVTDLPELWDESDVECMPMPTKEGQYVVWLSTGTIDCKAIDVDTCGESAKSDGGGFEWINYYPHNVLKWERIPDDGEFAMRLSLPEAVAAQRALSDLGHIPTTNERKLFKRLGQLLDA